MVRYAAVDNFWWLWLVPVVAAVLAYGIWQRRGALACFAGASAVGRLAAGVALARQLVKAACVVAAVVLVVLALAEPQWGVYRAAQRARGRDIFVALDVSRSMLAEDLIPNRLERAKADIRDLIAAVEPSGGHRLGLIAFAGETSVKCPLTQVYGHVKLVLDGLSTRSVARGGTLIGDCIRTAIDAFDDKTENFRDLVIITDGEDMESFPADAAAEARDAGITIYLVGIGDPVEGARIPVTDKSGQRTYLEHEGQEVWSKLDDQALRAVAGVPGVVYIPAGTRAVELDRIFRELIEPKTKRDLAEVQRERLHHRFQWFLAPAVLLLIAECFISSSRRVRPARGSGMGGARAAVSVEPATSVASARVRQSVLPVAVLLALIAAAAGPAHAEDAAALVRDGNRLYQQGKFAEAAERYEQAATLAPDSPVPLFNRAAVLFRAGEFAEAAERYEQARLRAPQDLRAPIHYALGNCHLQQAIRSQAQAEVATKEADTAVQFYRDAIITHSTTPEVADAARYNLELAKRLIKQLEIQQPRRQDSSQRPDEHRDENNRQPQDQQSQPDTQPQTAPDKAQSQSTDPAKHAQPSSTQQLSADEAAERLRAAIARAQMARARRLGQQTKQGKAIPADKDW